MVKEQHKMAATANGVAAKKANGSALPSMASSSVSNGSVSRYKNLGQHMTPAVLAKQMADLIKLPISEWCVIDPACGDGNLLLAVIDRMQAAGLTDIEQRIIGVDVDPKMVAAAKIRLAAKIGCTTSEVKVFHQDFLDATPSNLFNQPVYARFGCNVVISNPPYGQSREYDFFELCSWVFPKGTELIFLMPLAFLDRVNGIQNIPLNGRPMGVTTGHAIVYHKAGDPFVFRSVKENQSNSSAFSVLSGVKLYEVGGGVPPQSEAVVREKPFSSDEPKNGFIPCLRTGDIHAFEYELGRMFVNYGKHLAHPKELTRFQGPRVFVRRVPIWAERQLGAVYIEETALCAGDVLVIRHNDDDVELLKGLCVFLNSAKAADTILSNRPSLRYRDSFPKISAKDINALIEEKVPDASELRRMSSKYPAVSGQKDSDQPDREDWVKKMFFDCGIKLHHLGLNSDGSPKHPLYLRKDLKPTPF